MPRVAWIMVRVYAHTVVLCPLRPTPDLFHSSPLLSLSPCHVTSNARSSIAPNTCSNKGGGRVSVHLKNASIHPSIRIFFFFFTKRGENSSLGGSGPDRGKEGRKEDTGEKTKRKVGGFHCTRGRLFFFMFINAPYVYRFSVSLLVPSEIMILTYASCR